MIASNRSLAEFNLSQEPELEELKAQIQQKSETGEQLCNHIHELLEEYSKFALVYFFVDKNIYLIIDGIQ